LSNARHLDWEGCLNVRDLGGLSTVDGRVTRFGALVRADALDELTAAGWAALSAHGVRTIVDLRDGSERRAEEIGAEPVSENTTLLHVPVLAIDDEEFWAEWRWPSRQDKGRFYSAMLERWPDRFGQAVSAVARAEPGGVVVHCMAGRDRTGLVIAFLLTLAGVPRHRILADYGVSAERLRPRFEALVAGASDEAAGQKLLAQNNSDPEFIATVLDTFDVESYLLEAGVEANDLAAVRERLLEQI
jgi:protein tyrosine/serine phosphatase